MPLNFSSLPPELRQLILAFVAQDYLDDDYLHRRPSLSLAPYTAVNHEWQHAFERTIFSSLRLHPGRLDDFAAYLTGERRRRVKRIVLHARLDEYACAPCADEETVAEKLENNRRFGRTLAGFFEIMHGWEAGEAAPGGISLEVTVSSPSDFREAPFDVWDRRRWDRADIGDKRFLRSAVDFAGQDDEARKLGLLKPVYVISSFTAGSIGRRTVHPGAYGEIISALPCVRRVSLSLPKELRLPMRKLHFSQFSSYMKLWPASLESLVLCGQNNTDWRSLPHEVASEKDSGQKLSECLRDLLPRLRHLRVCNLIKIRDVLGPLWPSCAEDRGIVPLHAPDMPECERLETVHLHYASLMYETEWFKDSSDFNDQEVTKLWRHNIALAAARLAAHMPGLRLMTVTQRPLMWAGKHGLRYEVRGERAEVVFSSSFGFEPPGWVVDAWSAVGKKRGRAVRVVTERVDGVPTDGRAPWRPEFS